MTRSMDYKSAYIAGKLMKEMSWKKEIYPKQNEDVRLLKLSA